MKNIFRIFKSDLKGITTHFFALVVAIGICALPALYAWFNIYANWNPYDNTGNIRLAAAIEDAGWTDEEGNYLNIGEELRADLAESKSINWVFVGSDEEAQEGVKSGEYYAAISIGEDFSEALFSERGDRSDMPKLNYYLNDKKNAVATKITDSAVDSVQNSIEEKYIAIIAGKLFEEIRDTGPVSEAESETQKFIYKLGILRDDLNGYGVFIDSLLQSNSLLAKELEETNQSLENAGGRIKGAGAKLAEGAGNTAAAKDSLNAFAANVQGALGEVQARLNELASGISAAQLETDARAVRERINEMLPHLRELEAKLQTLLDAIMAIDPETIHWDSVAAEIRTLQNIIKILETNASKVAAETAAEILAESMHKTLQEMAQGIGAASAVISDELIPSINQLINSISTSLTSMQAVMNDLGSAVDTLRGMISQLGDTTDMLNVSMKDLKGILSGTSGSISDLIAKMDDASYREQIRLVTAFLSGDASAIGDYFAEPVSMKDNYLFEIRNYGSGVTPFYTALAIWVGVTVLVSVLKIRPDKKKFPDAKRSEIFIGRYLIFLLMSEFQTAIIVFGELCIFKIQCLHPGRFILASAIASLTISLVIYSLTVSFGDIGKAVAVIALVMQIAGSGGTYPIEILPGFFRNVYRFFPFPYIIDAMRECIGGMYGDVYIRCLLTLGLFCGAALLLGLLIRLPLIPLTGFIEKRLEDTELM